MGYFSGRLIVQAFTKTVTKISETQGQTSLLEFRVRRRDGHWIGNHQCGERRQQIRVGWPGNVFLLCGWPLCTAYYANEGLFTFCFVLVYSVNTSVFLSHQFLAGICALPALN